MNKGAEDIKATLNISYNTASEKKEADTPLKIKAICKSKTEVLVEISES